MSEDNLTAQSPAATYPEKASRDMIDAGVFYGRKKSKTHPQMKQYVLTNRGGIEIIDLSKTAEAMEAALNFLKEKIKGGALPLFVGTEPAAEEMIRGVASKFNFPYVINRWPGGSITNFKVISKRIDYFKKLRDDLKSGALQKYTKKERVEFDKELGRLRELFEGLEHLTKEPDVLIVIDPTLHHTAVSEANKNKIPIIALGNIDSDPEDTGYLVPGNDRSQKSINWFLSKIEEAIAEGIKMKAQAKEAAVAAAGDKAQAAGDANGKK